MCKQCEKLEKLNKEREMQQMKEREFLGSDDSSESCEVDANEESQFLKHNKEVEQLLSMFVRNQLRNTSELHNLLFLVSPHLNIPLDEIIKVNARFVTIKVPMKEVWGLFKTIIRRGTEREWATGAKKKIFDILKKNSNDLKINDVSVWANLR